jgi:predicted short-subunit dehydrogenase-like oxidoreductase (DUF2520 family)
LLKVFFIGSGRLNQNFANAFLHTDIEMVGVYSKTQENTMAFSQKFKTAHYPDLKSIPNDCDVYFLGVNDSEICAVSQELDVNGIVIHCSGFLSIDLLNKHKNRGVFWPIQTLSKDHYSNFSDVPICVEASDEMSLRILESLADKITKVPIFISEEKRKKLHIAAVFANNFTNHLFVLSKDFLHKNNLDFNLLMPLIQETVKKLSSIDPHLAQTGPASRKDLNTMYQHKLILENEEELLTIYQTISRSISEHYKQ